MKELDGAAASLVLFCLPRLKGEEEAEGGGSFVPIL